MNQSPGMKKLRKTIGFFPGVKVLVFGDLMLDRYWWGTAERISPEAPVPVVTLGTVTSGAGGAANVAANIAALDAKASLIGVVGDDECGRCLIDLSESAGVRTERIVKTTDRKTTCKIRVVVRNHQLLRVDTDTPALLTSEEKSALLENFITELNDSDAVVISDYNKGCASEEVVREIIRLSNLAGKPTYVDPKGQDFRKYNGCKLLTPNERELAIATGIDLQGVGSIDFAAGRLLENLEIGGLLVTLGEHGLKLYERRDKSQHIKSYARQVFDVTGAGDTVIACLSVALSAGADSSTAITLANFAAGLAVERVGTVQISRNDLLNRLSDLAG